MTTLEPYGRHLPLFPHIYDCRPITENALERMIERLMDRADAALLDNRATQDQYNSWVAALNQWANRVPLTA
jgi:hypothetical protein